MAEGEEAKVVVGHHYHVEFGRALQLPGETAEAVVKVKLEEESIASSSACDRSSLEKGEGEGEGRSKEYKEGDGGGASSSTQSGSAEKDAPQMGKKRETTEEIRFELLCHERVDPVLVEVRARDYDSGAAGEKLRKKIERLIGRSGKASHPLKLTSSEPQKSFKVFMEIPEHFPPSYTGTSVSYAYKLKVSTVKVVPSKKSASGCREFEKSSATFPICFWASLTHKACSPGRGVTRPPDDDDAAAEAFMVKAAEVGNDMYFKNRGKRPSRVSGSGSVGALGDGEYRDDLPSPGSSLRDYTMPEFMRYGRRNSHSGRESEDRELLSSLHLDRESCYNIFCGETCFVHLHLLGDLNVQPGDLIECVLDFLPTEVVCSKVAIELVAQETILRPKQTNRARRTSSRQAYADEDVVLHSTRTSFTFNVPRDSFPSFETDLIKLDWEIRFAFDIFTGTPAAKGELNWKLPVRLALKT
ncbi:hypothetical protein HOP50_04g33040 [Chloropicon primus]|uniref:Reduced growth phenotype protein 1 n=1 Tax=Chloropicon primus TaxID=1764295 RepID=A0A5B8MN74_9CHLO|nr:hypothetical protein A3770_04p33000 [Chloropicon primus]UPQ99994.1 hypothetical protein HOP50_04g33040 [Chloropicon primus]|eukprot:QDZ20782.1 hypothetical protein A3770_04p33000 [Chloropicon primus]